MGLTPKTEQISINPPIRGSIALREKLTLGLKEIRINPPIRGSIEKQYGKLQLQRRAYQSPYKGFNSRVRQWQIKLDATVSIPL